MIWTRPANQTPGMSNAQQPWRETSFRLWEMNRRKKGNAPGISSTSQHSVSSLVHNTPPPGEFSAGREKVLGENLRIAFDCLGEPTRIRYTKGPHGHLQYSQNHTLTGPSHGPANTFMRSVNEFCFPQSELSVSSSRNWQVRAKEITDRLLVSTDSSMTSLSSSSIPNIRCDMGGETRGSHLVVFC